jgi:hypothetical protein
MLKSGLVCLDWVAKVVLINLFFMISQEPANSLDTCSRLKILGVGHFFNEFLKGLHWCLVAHVQVLYNPAESAFESFKVPVLIDNLVNDSGLKDLAYFVGK